MVKVTGLKILYIRNAVGSTPTSHKESYMKVYGPYTRKDNRKHVCIVYSDGSKKTKSYAKYLLEQQLGRELTEDETADHINNDPSDDRIENLQVLSRSDNIAKAAALLPGRQMYTFTCLECGKQATKYLNYVLNNTRMGKRGPFCSRRCAGISNGRLRACSSAG